MRIELIIFYVLLLDALAANLFAWFGDDKFYSKKFRLISRYFPLARGWTTLYLLLVLFIGAVLYRYGIV